MTRVFLIRHGEPAESARGRCYGSLDVPLSPLGERQADELAAGLAGFPLATVYASPRRRALETAARIARAHGLDAVAVPALVELDFGELEGASYDEIARERPELYRRWMDAPTTVRFPGGESYADLRARVTAALAGLRARHAGRAFALVAHGGVLRAALAEALALPDESIFRLDQRYGCVDVVDWFGDTPLVRVVNVGARALVEMSLDD